MSSTAHPLLAATASASSSRAREYERRRVPAAPGRRPGGERPGRRARSPALKSQPTYPVRDPRREGSTASTRPPDRRSAVSATAQHIYLRSWLTTIIGSASSSRTRSSRAGCAGGAEVERGQRLVEEEERGRRHQRARERDALALAAREPDRPGGRRARAISSIPSTRSTQLARPRRRGRCGARSCAERAAHPAARSRPPRRADRYRCADEKSDASADAMRPACGRAARRSPRRASSCPRPTDPKRASERRRLASRGRARRRPRAGGRARMLRRGHLARPARRGG